MAVSRAHPLGVHSHLFRGTPDVAAEACARHGLTCLQLTPNFPGLVFHDPGQITPERCRQAAAPLHAAGIQIACLSGYANLMDPDLERRHRGILRLHALIRCCRDFGADRIVTETGSLSPKTPWLPHAANRSPAAWTELQAIVAEALVLAAEHDVQLLLKVEPAHVLASVEDALRLRWEMDHPHLGFIMDPAHFLFDVPPAEWDARLEDFVEQLGPSTPVVHCKDLRVDANGVSMPAVGRGMLDYGRFLRALDRCQPHAPLILEHLRADEVDEATAYLRRIMGS